MKKKISIIVGGSGQLGICLSKQLLKKNYKVLITTRNISLTKKKFYNINKNIKYLKLDVLKIKEVKSLIKSVKPNIIFYFAGQSSPALSFKKNKDTYLSNFQGCENFLNGISEINPSIKFVNASSSEIFADTKKKIKLSSKKKPISPYGKAKLKSFNTTKHFREKKKLKTYNAIIFNTESYFRNKTYLIPKICIAAINAKKFNRKTAFGNLNISREWNWGDEQMTYLIKFIKKKPQDFILSNGHYYSAKKMMEFAFKHFGLNYKDYIKINKNFIRPKDFLIKKSKFQDCLNRNNITRVSKTYGKKIIQLLIRFYLNEKEI